MQIKGNEWKFSLTEKTSKKQKFFSRCGSWKTYLESSEGFGGVRVRRKNIPKSLFTKILISLTSIGRENLISRVEEIRNYSDMRDSFRMAAMNANLL